MNDRDLRFLFLMDRYETLNLDTETSLLCMDELMARGHGVYWLEQSDLFLSNSTVKGMVSRLIATDPFKLEQKGMADADRADAQPVNR